LLTKNASDKKRLDCTTVYISLSACCVQYSTVASGGYA
jgi:hypothetical protein